MRRTLVGIVFGAVLFAGCGSSASPEPSAPGGAQPTAVATPQATPEPSSPTSGGVNPFDCTGVTAAIDAGANGGQNPTGAAFDPDAIAASLRQFAANGPTEIRADLETLAGAWTTYLTALSEAGIDLSDPGSFANMDQAKLAKFAEAAAAMDTAAVQLASDNVEAYMAAHCG